MAVSDSGTEALLVMWDAEVVAQMGKLQILDSLDGPDILVACQALLD